jgi:hypothetical protein
VEDLNTDVEVGHLSTGWCNLANIAFQTGKPFTEDDARQVEGDKGVWSSLLEEMREHLSAHGLKIDGGELLLSPMLTVDVENETFTGEHAEAANALLKRQYRTGYEVPEIA